MNLFKASRLAWAASKFAIYKRSFGGTAVLPVTQKTVQNFLTELGKAERAFRQSGMTDGANKMKSIAATITASSAHVAAALSSEAAHARMEVIDQLKKRKFLRVHSDVSALIDQDKLFGQEVATAFPMAQRDIRESGNCLAAECHTAAVFHLMRAAEIALRALAADRGLDYPDASLESKQVGDLLGKLDTEVCALRTTDWRNWGAKGNDIKNAQINFYHRAIVEFRDFNEAWRRHMAHAHEGAFYDRPMAMSIMAHVRTCMQVLAEKISETTTTPKYWTSV